MFGTLSLYLNSFVVRNAGALNSSGGGTPSSSLLSGLLAYWGLNTLTSPFTNSVSGGTAPTLVQSNSGAGLSVTTGGVDGTNCLYIASTGTNEGAYIPTASTGNTSGVATISFWYKQGAETAGDNTNRGLFDIQSNAYYGAALYCSTSSQTNEGESTNFDFDSNGFANTSTSYTEYDNVNGWHHIVIKVNSVSGSLQTYVEVIINNVLAATFDTNTSFSGSFSAANLTSMAFGFDYQSDDSIEGYIDEICIWNRHLTSTEISTLYNAGAGNTYPF